MLGALWVLLEDNGFTTGFLLCFVRVLLPAPPALNREAVLHLHPRTNDERWGSLPHPGAVRLPSARRSTGSTRGSPQEGCSSPFSCPGSHWGSWVCNLTPRASVLQGRDLFQPVSSLAFSSVQFSSVAQPCPTLCNPMNRSTPGLPVHHHLPEVTQTHVHRVSDAIQPSHPLSSPSPPAPNPSQHQSLFQ